MNWSGTLAKLLESLPLNLKQQMSALQGRVLSDKIAEVVLPDGKFAEIYKAKVLHHAAAMNSNNMIYAAGLAAQVVVIDGQQKDIEYYLAMDLDYFTEIMKHVK